MANPTCLPATGVTSTGGVANGNADNIPVGQFLRVSYGTAPGGPYATNGANVAGTGTLDQPASVVVAGQAPGTAIYYVVQELAADGVTVLATSTECTFTTAAVPGSGFQPMPCPSCAGGGGTGEAGLDVEQNILCDVGPDGEVFGTALAVYEYDENGAPTGPPTFVDPVTGAPYVAQGILQPCAGDVGCQAPVQFCFTTTTTGPVDHPGRLYDLTLPINPGFAVDSLQIDATGYPANLTWAVTDPDGEQFRVALQAFLAARFPNETVTVTNPNAGNPVCGLAIPMTIHIECARIDGTAPAPDLVELIYNGGRDLVVNPAYLTTPPTNLNGPQFVYLQRQDAGGTLNCTSVANRGWETNDLGPGNSRDFELWGQGPGGLQTTEAATPTPRGTPIQEITADINDTGAGPTIWQTFVVPAAGTVRAVLVHGSRDTGEQHRITLSTGDTNDNQVGDIINNVTNPPQVTNAGGGSPGPWTTFQQDVALGAGTYTFAISTTNPVGANRGGLFTDMRVIIDSPDQHAAAVTDDDTCVVTVDETVTTTTCEYWAPRCINGEIVSWKNVADGQELLNAAFWGQAPAPECCIPAPGEGGGGTVTPGNLVHNYDVCGIVAGTPTSLQRVVITDQSGGVLAQTFVGPDGGPVTPSSWVMGPCSDGNCSGIALGAGCYNPAVGPQANFVSVRNCDGTVSRYDAVTGADVTQYIAANGMATCLDTTYSEELLCDANGVAFLRRYFTTDQGNPNPAPGADFQDFDLSGAPFLPTLPVGRCPQVIAQLDTEIQILCDSTAPTPVRFLRRYVYDAETPGAATVTNTTLDGVTPYAPVGAVGVCTQAVATDFDFTEELLCDATPTPFIRRFTFNSQTGAVTATTNLTLAGAAFVPVGAVGLCTNCCPIEIGQGCYNAGSGRYTALRLANGTISLIDSVTGAAVLAANIIPCANDDTAVTLNSQHRLVGDADAPWTPGADVVGTLTSVTYTVLSGTADVTDQNGTVAAGLPPGLSVTWNAEDNNTLAGPTSIDAVAGSTYVHWTVR